MNNLLSYIESDKPVAAPNSNFPPFDVTVPEGEDPEEFMRKYIEATPKAEPASVSAPVYKKRNLLESLADPNVKVEYAQPLEAEKPVPVSTVATKKVRPNREYFESPQATDLSWRQGSERDWQPVIAPGPEEAAKKVQQAIKEVPKLKAQVLETAAPSVELLKSRKNLSNLQSQIDEITKKAVNNALPSDLYVRYKDLADQFQQEATVHDAAAAKYTTERKTKVDLYNTKAAELKTRLNRLQLMPPEKVEGPTLLQQIAKGLGVDQALGMDEETVRKRRVAIENARAAVTRVGGPTEGPKALEIGARKFGSEMALGIPEAILKARGELPEEPTTALERVFTGAGTLGGFVAGMPVSVARGVAGGVRKMFPGLEYAGTESLLKRTGQLAAAEVPGLTAATASAAIGEALNQKDITDALKVIGSAAKSGAEMGGAFAIGRGVVLGNDVADIIKRVAFGTAVLDASRGTHPFDARELDQKVIDYGLNLFFLWKGLPKERQLTFFKDMDATLKGEFPDVEALRKQFGSASEVERAEILRKINSGEYTVKPKSSAASTLSPEVWKTFLESAKKGTIPAKITYGESSELQVLGVLNGERPVAMLEILPEKIPENITVISDKRGGYFVYRSDNFEAASPVINGLKDIYKRIGKDKISIQDTVRIGNLLKYDISDINAYIVKTFDADVIKNYLKSPDVIVPPPSEPTPRSMSVDKGRQEIALDRSGVVREPAGEPFVSRERPPELPFQPGEVVGRGVKEGEGFTITNPPVDTTPQLNWRGKPFKTEVSAEKAALKAGIPANAFEVLPSGEGFAFARVDIRPRPVDTTVKPEAAEVPKSGTITDVAQKAAEEVGVEFKGIGKDADGNDYALYEDPKTGSSFQQIPGETLSAAVDRIRKPFEVEGKVDRRRVARKKASDMTPDEIQKELEAAWNRAETDVATTGLRNKEAYAAVVREPVQAVMDLDGLKWINDNFSYEQGSNLLKHVGKAMKESGLEDVYRTGGDEFVIEGKTEVDVAKAVEKVRSYLDSNPLTLTDKEGKQHTITAKFSHGIGKNTDVNSVELSPEAETNLKANKKSRKEAGESAARGAALDITPVPEKGASAAGAKEKYVHPTPVKATPEMKAIAKAIGYKGRKFRQGGTPPTQLDSYWTEGTKDTYHFYNKADGRMLKLPTNHPFFEAGAARRMSALPEGVILVRHTIFQGKDIGLTFWEGTQKAPQPAKSAVGRGKVKRESLIDQEKITAGADLTTTKARLLKDAAGYDPARTVVAELLQNSLDAIGDSKAPIEVTVGDGFFSVRDSGKGMTPKVMSDDFVNLFRQGTKGELDMGGFGFAKLPIMGWPDSFDVISTAVDPETGKKFTSHVWGTREEYMENHEVNFESKETSASDHTPTGTIVTLSKNDLSPEHIVSRVKNFAKSLRTGTNISIEGFDSGGDAVSEKLQPPEFKDVKSMYKPLHITSGESEIDVKFVKLDPYGGYKPPYQIRTTVMNKGLVLPDIPQYTQLGRFQLSKKPNFTIEINFSKTPAASDVENYPFTNNRTRIIPEVESDIVRGIGDVLDDLESQIHDAAEKSLKKSFDGAPSVGGTKIIIPFVETDIHFKIHELIKSEETMFKALGRLYKDYSDMLAKYSDIKGHTFAITTHPDLHGFRPRTGILDTDYIVVNPFSYIDPMRKNVTPEVHAEELRQAGTALTDTLTHEATHQKVSEHYVNYVQAFHEVQKALGHKRLSIIERKANEFFNVFEVNLRAVEKELRDIQKPGTLIDVFSDYTPNEQRIGESAVDAGRGVYAGRPEGVGEARSGRPVNRLLEALERPPLTTEVKAEIDDYNKNVDDPAYKIPDDIEVVTSEVRRRELVGQWGIPNARGFSAGSAQVFINDDTGAPVAYVPSRRALMADKTPFAEKKVTPEDIQQSKEFHEKYVEKTPQAKLTDVLRKEYPVQDTIVSGSGILFPDGKSVQISDTHENLYKAIKSKYPDTVPERVKNSIQLLREFGGVRTSSLEYSTAESRRRGAERYAETAIDVIAGDQLTPKQLDAIEEVLNKKGATTLGVYNEVGRYLFGGPVESIKDIRKFMNQGLNLKPKENMYDMLRNKLLVMDQELMKAAGETVPDKKRIEQLIKDRDALRKEVSDNNPYGFDTLAFGFDPIAAVKAMRALGKDVKAGITNLEKLGEYVFETGKTKYFDWQKTVKSFLGDMWGKFKGYVSKVWDRLKSGEIGPLKNQWGAVGKDIGKEPIAKQRTLRRSERTRLSKIADQYKKVLDKVEKELAEITGPNGKKKFEDLKNKRIEKFIAEIAKLKEDPAAYRKQGYQRAIEMLKKREYTAHVNHLKASKARLEKMIDKRLAKAAATADTTDVTAPAILEKDFNRLKSLPDIRNKPLSGFTQNPIYTWEDWGGMVGPKAAKWVKDTFYYPIRKATHQADAHFTRVFKAAEAIRDKLPKESGRNIGIHAFNQEVGGPEILKEMGITEIPKLTPEEMKAYKWMRGVLDLFYDYVNEGRVAAGKEPFGKVGNYFTFAKELSMAERLGFGFDDALLSDYIHAKATTFPYAKHRIGGMTKAQLNAFEVFENYIRTATKHMYLSPEIAKIREYTGQFKYRDSEGKLRSWEMSEKQPNAYKAIQEYADFVAGQKRVVLPKNIEAALQMLNKNITYATLSGNIRSAMIQPTALLNTYVEIGPYYTQRGVVGLFTDKRIEANKKSKVLLNREFDISVSETGESFSQIAKRLGKDATTLDKALTFGGTALAKISKGRDIINKSWLGMKALKFLDMETATATWIGAYDKAIEVDKLSEADAVDYADDTVVKTQGSAAAHDLSPAQRIVLGKFFTTFQTFVINNFNWLVKDVMGIKNARIPQSEMLKKAAKYIIGTTLINFVFEDWLDINSPLPSPISAARKEYKKSGSLGHAAVTGGLEMLQLVQGLGGLRYGSSILGAPVEFLGDASEKIAEYGGKGITSPARKASDKFLELGGDKGLATRPGVELLGKLMGVPNTSQVVKTVRGLGRGDTVVESLLGKRAESKEKGGSNSIRSLLQQYRPKLERPQRPF